MKNKLNERPSILVVDDEVQSVRLLTKVLNEEGYKTHSAYGGSEALAITKVNKFDLILLDVMMPGVSGFEVCKALSKEDSTKAIPIIFISSLHDRKSIKKGFELGAYDYFSKPINRTEVIAKIDNCLRYRSVEKTLREEIVLRKETSKVIRIISEETAGKTGLSFFNDLVITMSEILGVDYVFTGEWKSSNAEVIQTYGVCHKGELMENFEYELLHTPCNTVLNNKMCSYPGNVQEKFPDDHMLVEMGVVSYMGIPLFGKGKVPLGLLTILHSKPIENIEYTESIIKAFSVRASAELERKKMLEELEQREEMFNNAFHHAIIGRSLADPTTGLFLWVNDSLCNILGYSKEELLQLTWMSVTHPDHIEESQSKIQELVNHKIKHFTLTQKILNSEGELLWINLNIVLINDSKGKPKYIHSDIIDITKNKEAERSLQMASDIVQNTMSGLHIYHLEDSSDDRSLRMVAANPAAETMTGVSNSEIIGKTLDENFPGLRAKGIPQKYAEVINKQKPLEIEDITYADDRVLTNAFSVKAFPLPNKQLGVTFENITNRKKYEATILKESEINKKFSDLATILINPKITLKDISETTLSFARELTGSQEGFLSIIDTKNGDNICYALTNDIKKSLGKNGDHLIRIPRGGDGKYDGLTGYALNTSKAFFTNTPEKHQAWVNRTNEESFTLHRILAVPARVGNKLVGEIVLMNPDQDFTNQDLKTIRHLTNLFAVAVNRKEIEDALKESEERYRVLAQSTIEGIFISDETYIVDGNRQILEMFGYEKSELIGRECIDLMAPESHDLFRKQSRSNNSSSLEYLAIRKDGLKFPVLMSGKSIPFEGKKHRITSVRDITERKEMQRRVLNTSIKAEEKERRRFAQELHDGLGPLLSSAKLYIKSLETIKDNEKKQYATTKSIEIIEESISTIREIANNISPHVLKSFGLVAALRSFIKQISGTTNIEIGLQANFSERLPENIEITLFRVLVELIHNTLKHAGADFIYILLEAKKDFLYVDFKDDGRGFDFEKTIQKLSGQGLSNILNRIQSLNGTVIFNKQIEKGSRVQIEIKMMHY